VFEGGFFGNLFAPMPVAYTCRGERTPAQAQDLVLQDRVCTQATNAHTASGQPITRCRFILTGRCEEAASLTVDGQPATEVINMQTTLGRMLAISTSRFRSFHSWCPVSSLIGQSRVELFFEMADLSEVQHRLHNAVFVTGLEVAIG